MLGHPQMRYAKSLLLFLVAATIVLSPLGAQGPAPDAIFVNGKILTVDERFSLSEAFAITAGRISGVGTNATIRAQAGAGTVVTDLAGRMVLPGLIDSHVHAPAASM